MVWYVRFRRLGMIVMNDEGSRRINRLMKNVVKLEVQVLSGAYRFFEPERTEKPFL